MLSWPNSALSACLLGTRHLSRASAECRAPLAVLRQVRTLRKVGFWPCRAAARAPPGPFFRAQTPSTTTDGGERARGRGGDAGATYSSSVVFLYATGLVLVRDILTIH